jgi:hypothetical protein
VNGMSIDNDPQPRESTRLATSRPGSASNRQFGAFRPKKFHSSGNDSAPPKASYAKVFGKAP